MKIIEYPSRDTWREILKRPVLETVNLFDTVQKVINDVRNEGDSAVIAYESIFDKVNLDTLAVTEAEIAEGVALVDDDLKAAIVLAKNNIEKFHEIGRAHV